MAVHLVYKTKTGESGSSAKGRNGSKFDKKKKADI